MTGTDAPSRPSDSAVSGPQPVTFMTSCVSVFSNARIGMPLVGCRLLSGFCTYDERAPGGSDITDAWLVPSAKLNRIATFDLR